MIDVDLVEKQIKNLKLFSSANTKQNKTETCKASGLFW